MQHLYLLVWISYYMYHLPEERLYILDLRLVASIEDLLGACL
jgi:hypothetical protein